jgi:hypothetical protein
MEAQKIVQTVIRRQNLMRGVGGDEEVGLGKESGAEMQYMVRGEHFGVRWWRRKSFGPEYWQFDPFSLSFRQPLGLAVKLSGNYEIDIDVSTGSVGNYEIVIELSKGSVGMLGVEHTGPNFRKRRRLRIRSFSCFQNSITILPFKQNQHSALGATTLPSTTQNAPFPFTEVLADSSHFFKSQTISRITLIGTKNCDDRGRSRLTHNGLARWQMMARVQRQHSSPERQHSSPESQVKRTVLELDSRR